MTQVLKILLQTTIPPTTDDWGIDRFSLLRDFLSTLEDSEGNEMVQVTARDREVDEEGNDLVLSNLAETDFDELWLFAVDVGEGLTAKDCDGNGTKKSSKLCGIKTTALKAI